MIFQCNYVWKKKIHTERAAQIGVSFRECHSNPLLTLTEWISHRRLVCLWLWCKAFFFFFEINLFLLLRRHSSDITAMSDNDIITPSPEECLSSLALANTVLWKQQECDLAHTHLHCYISTHTHGTKRKRKGKQIDRESIKNNADTRPHCSWPARKLHLRFHFTFKACAAEVSEVKS